MAAFAAISCASAAVFVPCIVQWQRRKREEREDERATLAAAFEARVHAKAARQREARAMARQDSRRTARASSARGDSGRSALIPAFDGALPPSRVRPGGREDMEAAAPAPARGRGRSAPRARSASADLERGSSDASLSEASSVEPPPRRGRRRA